MGFPCYCAPMRFPTDCLSGSIVFRCCLVQLLALTAVFPADRAAGTIRTRVVGRLVQFSHRRRRPFQPRCASPGIIFKRPRTWSTGKIPASSSVRCGTSTFSSCSGTSNLFFRLESDTSLALSSASADATTIQLNWPPIPAAVEYKIYRNGNYIGSTAGRCGYFTDTGLAPATSYNYFLAAYDAENHLLGFSVTNTFSTTASSRIRTHYKLLAIGFYPTGPDARLPPRENISAAQDRLHEAGLRQFRNPRSL